MRKIIFNAMSHNTKYLFRITSRHGIPFFRFPVDVVMSRVRSLMTETRYGIGFRSCLTVLSCGSAFYTVRLEARPIETISTDATAVGHYEAQGALGFSRDPLGNIDTQLFSLFNWGLTPSAQFEIKVTDDFLQIDDGHRFETTTAHFRPLIQIWNDAAKTLTIGIQPELIVNSNIRGGFNPGSAYTYGNTANFPKFNETLTLIATKRFGTNTYLDFNVAYTAVSRINSTSSSTFVGLAFRHNFPGNWQLMSEIYSGVPTYKVVNTVGVVDIAINYAFKSGFKPDILVGAGLNKTSPEIIVETGFTYDW
jgi:hypothetical protein